MSEAFGLLQTAMVAALGWFDQILTYSGVGGYLMAAVFITLCWRFLLSPVLSRGSDSAAGKRGKNDV